MRIQPSTLHKVPWYLKLFFWRQKKKYGQVLVPALVWAQIPRLFITVASLYGVLDRKKSPLSPVLRSLVTVRISQINWCRFCVDVNSATLIQRSGSNKKLAALSHWRESSHFADQEKAALDYAEKITYSDQSVDENCFNALKQYFKEKDIIELTALIGFQNMSSKFNSALDIAPQGFCEIKSDLDIEP